MVKKNRVILFMTAISSMVVLSLVVTTASGDDFTPPPPDKTKTLLANNGGPDGCDSSRFKCLVNGAAVQDKQTGLIWLRDTRFDNKSVPWQEAADFCQSFELGNKKDWKLPTRDELITLLDTSKSNPAFPGGHPFKLRDAAYTGGGGYWTSTDYEDDNKYAWRVQASTGRVGKSMKIFDAGIWPVYDNN